MGDVVEELKRKKMKELMKKIELSKLPYKIDVTSKNFEKEVLERSKEIPVILDFWAEWCTPCLMIGPILERIVKKYRGKVILAKINTDKEKELATKYGIMSIPTVKLVKNGKVVDEFVGALPEEMILKWLRKHVDLE